MSYGGPPPSNGNGGFGAPPPPNNGGFGAPPPMGGGGGGGGGFGGGFGGPPPPMGGGFGPPPGGGFSAVPATPMAPQPAKSGSGVGTILMVIGGVVVLAIGGSCLAGFLAYRRAATAVSEATAQYGNVLASAQAAAAQQQALAAQQAMAAQMNAGSYATANPYGAQVPTPPMGMGGAGPRMLPDPNMMMNPPRVTGGLDYAAVAPVFVANHAAMVQCFNTARAGTETLMRPQVRMSVIIRNGAVSGTPYVGTLSPSVDMCIQGVLQRSSFPSSPRVTIVSMPTDLSQ